MKAKAILLVLFIILLVATIALQFDDSLSDSAQQLANDYKQHSSQDSPAFIYLVGISEPESSDAKIADINIDIANVNYLLAGQQQTPVNPYNPSISDVTVQQDKICMLSLQGNQQCIIIMQ